MKSLRITGWAVLSFAALMGCSQPDEVEQREQFASCDDGRPSTLYVARDLPDAERAVADGNDGFWLFQYGTSAGHGVVRVDHQGVVVEHLEDPLGPTRGVESMVSTGDGGAILVANNWLNGVVGLEALTGPPSYPEVVRMEADWTVRWHTPVGVLGANGTSLVALSDGGAIVAGGASVAELQNSGALSGPLTASTAPEDERGMFWARLSGAGEVLWQRSTLFSTPKIWGGPHLSGQSLVLGSDGRARMVVQTREGLLLVSSDLDGEAEQEQLLDTRLALSLIDAVALPDDRLAILSDRQSAIVTLIDADGTVLWEKGFGPQHLSQAGALAFNAERDEILVGGNTRGQDFSESGTWLFAANTDGEQIWSIEREGLDVGGTDGVIGEVDATRGPYVVNLAVAPDGSALAAGAAGDQLSYFQLGNGACQ